MAKYYFDQKARLFALIVKAEQSGKRITAYDASHLSKKYKDLYNNLGSENVPTKDVYRYVEELIQYGLIVKSKDPSRENGALLLTLTQKGRSLWENVLRPFANETKTQSQLMREHPKEFTLAIELGLASEFVHLVYKMGPNRPDMDTDLPLIEVRILKSLIDSHPFLRHLDRRLPSLGIFRRRHGI